MAELDSETRVIRQHADEALKTLQVETEVCLELEQDRPELVTEAERRLDDQVDGLLLDGQPLDVGDVTAALDGKQEARRGLLLPGDEALPRRNRK